MLHNSISTDDFFVALDRHEAWVKRVQLLESLDNEGKLILFEHELGNFRISNRDLSSCELIRCRLRNMTFIECDFTAALLIGSVFENCTFNDCSFYKADIGDSIAIGADFSGSRLIKAELPRAILAHAHLRNCDLTSAMIAQADLRYIDWDSARLDRAYIVESKLYNTAKFKFESFDGLVVNDSYFDFWGEEDIRSGLAAWKELLVAQ